MELTISHQTAATESIDAEGVTFAYRRFGRPSAVPLVLLQHFRGNLDNWDPAFTDALAAEREIILVDAPGVGASTGAPKRTVAETARSILAFLDALGLREIDLLGFSLGGFVAQELALLRPWAIRRLVLVGTGPKGAPGMHGWREDIQENSRHDEGSGEDLLYLFFAHTETSQAKGTEFLGRFLQRTEDRDATPSLASHLMAGLIPDAEIRIYPDAAHGSIFQYPTEAAQDVSAFLDARRPKTPR